MPDLPDANVWLALAWDGHAGHHEPRTWWEAALPDSVRFCRLSQMALLRLLTNASLMGEDVRTQVEAWNIYQALCRSARVQFVEEPAGFEECWRSLSSRSTPSVKKWSDDYLAAMATLGSLRMVTFDDGFRTCPGLAVRWLTMPSRPAQRTP